MFTEIISAKHVSHSFRCSDKDRSFEFWSFLIKVYQKCGKVSENVCFSKNKMFVKETFPWNTQYKILGNTIRWDKWWICEYIKLLTLVSDFRQKWTIKQISYSSNSCFTFYIPALGTYDAITMKPFTKVHDHNFTTWKWY